MNARTVPNLRPLALVALVALLFRAWIPAGFMPAADGSLSLVLCPGVAPAITSTTHAPNDRASGHHHHDGQREKAAESPCPFAVASLAAAPSGAILPPPPPALFAALIAPAAPSLAPSFAFILPPSTGPPTNL